MPYAHEETWRKAHAANRGGLYRVIHGEDPQFMTELRALLPNIPSVWQRIEIYAPSREKEQDTPLRQVWVLGETGELLIDSMIDPVDGLVVRAHWFREHYEPDGKLDTTLSSRLLDVVNQTIMRYRASGHRVQ